MFIGGVVTIQMVAYDIVLTTLVVLVPAVP